MERRLVDVERRLAANRRLVGDAVHRLRSPLNAIVSWLHVLDGDTASAADAVAARRAFGRSCQTIARELDRLLLGADWLAADSGYSPVDIGQLAAATVASLSREEARGLVAGSTPSGCLVAGEEGRLRWLVRELVGAARGELDRERGLVVVGDQGRVELWLARMPGQDDAQGVAVLPVAAPVSSTAAPDSRRSGSSAGSSTDLFALLVELQGGQLLRPTETNGRWLLGIRWPRWEEV